MAPAPEDSSTQPVQFVAGRGGNALLLSMRGVANVVGYTPMYEFEDLVAELMDADLAVPNTEHGLERSRRTYKLTRYLTGSKRIAEAIRPRAGAISPPRKYELFLAVFNHPHELFNLNALRGWRERCHFAACYINEAWEAQLPVYLLELLKPFDHVFLGVNGACEAVAGITGSPCTYVPMGVDALRFRPGPDPSERLIDICGVGRRSAVTHSALLELAQRDGLFYYYDTMRRGRGGGAVTFEVIDHREHRLLFSNILKRSRYFIANRAWADRPGLTRGKDEISSRFYEGAAAGTVMLGEPPDTPEFHEQFDWPDAIVRTPFDAPAIAETIRELDAAPTRTARIRRDGVVNALLRHDWSHRLREVTKMAGLPPTSAMLARESRLRAAANEIRATSRQSA